MDEPTGNNNRRPGLWTALLITAIVRAVTVTLLLTVFWPTPAASHLVQDIRTWRDFFAETQSGAIPYVNLTKEYPVLGGILYWLMSPFVRPDDLRQTIAVHAAFMGIADLVNAALFHRLAREIAPRWAFAATLALGLNLTAIVTAPVRYESWIVTFVLLGYMAHRRRRFWTAAALWSIGCGLKWYPAFFIAAQEWRLFVVERRRWHWVGAGAVFAAVTAALNLPFALLCLRETGSLANWLAPYVFHVKRPLYWDTLLGVGQIWLGALPWERYAGLWSLFLMLTAVAVRPRMSIEYKGVLICLAAVFFNRIYSTQFNLWFYPFLILGMLGDARRDRRRIAATFVILDLLNVLIYPISFAGAVAEMGGFFPGAARAGGRWTIVFSAAIVMRTVVVAVLAVLVLHGGHQRGGWLMRREGQGGQGGAGASESKVAPETESG